MGKYDSNVTEFNNSRKTLLNLMCLRVGKGRKSHDEYSKMSTEELEARIQQEDLAVIRDFCYHELLSDYKSSLRWFLRGLSARDAVKKTVVDNINVMLLIDSRQY